MTIAQLIKNLTEYANDNEKGFDTEVRAYVENGFVYIRATDIPEVEPQESEG